MCTVGVIRVADGMLFFKNRDLGGQYLRRRRTVWHAGPDYHALMGVNLQTGAIEGVSIGINKHQVCVANTHVATTPDVAYDALCEEFLARVRTRRQIERITRAFLARQAVQGGKILVATRAWACLVEVLGKISRICDVPERFVMTNTFDMIRHVERRPHISLQNSANRLRVARRALPAIHDIGGLKSLLRSHEPAKGQLSICNHRTDGGGTESSHILHVQKHLVTWSALMGRPCENDYNARQWPAL